MSATTVVSNIGRVRPLEEQMRLEGKFSVDSAERDHPAEAKAVKANYGTAIDIASRFEDELDAAEGDEDLSPSGKIHAAERAAATARQRVLDNLVKPRDAVETRLRSEWHKLLGAAAPQLPASLSELDRALIFAEVRAELRGLDPIARDMLVTTSPDAIVHAAAETAPPVLYKPPGGKVHEWRPFVDPAKLAEARAARVRATNPEGAALLERLERDAARLRSLSTSLLRAIDERVPSAAPDPTVEPPAKS